MTSFQELAESIRLIPREEYHPFPRWGEKCVLRKDFIPEAEQAAQEPVLALPATRFMDFQRNGNRTRYEGLSMKNRETWDFAHKHLGDLWFKLGAPLLAVTSVVSLLVFRESTENITLWCCVILVIQMVIMVTPVYFTEKALKKNFDENGKWRSKEAKEQWLLLDAKRKKDYEDDK